MRNIKNKRVQVFEDTYKAVTYFTKNDSDRQIADETDLKREVLRNEAIL